MECSSRFPPPTEAGADCHFVPPLNSDGNRRVLELTGRQRRHNQPEGPPMTPPTRDAAPIDLAAALARLGGDRELLRDLAGLFLEDCPGWVEAIRESICRENAAGLKRAAHSLAGSVGYFNA